jgi:Fe-Mn family superoxide dismutase
MSQYVLPPLPYDYAALEPHISRRIVQLHHDAHHAAYVKNANAALEKLEAARKAGDFSAIPALERSLAFNLSGHVLHSIYWRNLTPNGGGEPTGALKEQIEKDFGSFASFRKQLTEAAATCMGSGWGALVWEPIAGRLLVTQVYDHQSNLANGSVPIMVLDAWEHAWYLQYENRKAEYFEAVWNVWNWADVTERLAGAKKVGINLADAAG